MLSTKATCNSHGQDSSYFLGWEAYEKNPFDEASNPKGIIQMGLAENQVIITYYISLNNIVLYLCFMGISYSPFFFSSQNFAAIL